MIELLTMRDRDELLFPSMFADRKRVFVDLFGWDIQHDGVHEVDEFDDEHAEYLILSEDGGLTHRASIRLLPTERPHLMSEIFADFCDDGVPEGPNIREITRFCIAPRGRAKDRLVARNMLARSLIEYGLLNGVTGYTAICHMGLLQQVLSAGWRCRPLGMPRMFAGEMVGAILIEVSAESHRMMVENWRCDHVALRVYEDATLAA